MKSLFINNIFYLKYNKKNIIPLIIQEIFTKKILMFAWVDYKNIINIFLYNNLFYYSRNNLESWLKGVKSKNYQYIKNIFIDCDMDIILFQIIQIYNISCHTNSFSCFKKL